MRNVARVQGVVAPLSTFDLPRTTACAFLVPLPARAAWLSPASSAGRSNPGVTSDTGVGPATASHAPRSRTLLREHRHPRRQEKLGPRRRRHLPLHPHTTHRHPRQHTNHKHTNHHHAMRHTRSHAARPASPRPQSKASSAPDVEPHPPPMAAPPALRPRTVGVPGGRRGRHLVLGTPLGACWLRTRSNCRNGDRVRGRGTITEPANRMDERKRRGYRTSLFGLRRWRQW